MPFNVKDEIPNIVLAPVDVEPVSPCFIVL